MLVGYEMIIANLALQLFLAIHPFISNKCKWNNCLINIHCNLYHYIYVDVLSYLGIPGICNSFTACSANP